MKVLARAGAPAIRGSVLATGAAILHDKTGARRVAVAAPMLLVAGLVIVGLTLTPQSIHAQNPSTDAENPEIATPDSVRGPRRHNPGGAFLRSVLIPGWGQASVGSPNRGGFYFGVESITLWMLMKTSKTLGSAKDIAALRRAEAEARVIAGGEDDPVEIERLVDADEAVQTADQLVEVRSQQKEDWLAVGIFFLFLGGADAFVAAHLADFPQPLEASLRPLPDVGAELTFSVPFNPFRPRARTSGTR